MGLLDINEFFSILDIVLIHKKMDHLDQSIILDDENSATSLS